MTERTDPPSPWNLPNVLTVLRILLVPVFGYCLLVEHGVNPGWRFAAFGVFTVAIATDFVDGRIARARGLETDFGRIADPIADKALVGTALVLLSWLGELGWWVTVVILVREALITALRFLIIRIQVLPASRGGKLKTALQSVALGLYLLPLEHFFGRTALWPGKVLMLAAVIVTVVTGLDYLVSTVRLVRRRRDVVDAAR